MRKNVLGALLAIFGAFALCVPAQVQPTKPPPPVAPPPTAPPVAQCPQIQVQTATQPVRDGSPLKFTVILTGGDTNVAPTFSWSISSGIVADGQGTRNISVDTTGAGADRQIIADLLIGGFPPECINQATATVQIAGPAKKIDEFDDLPETTEIERLNTLVAVLAPTTDRVYIFAYAGRTNIRGYASTAARRIKTHLVKSGISSDRVASIDGGFKDQPNYEVWIVPVGAEVPRPAPTVDRKEIVYPKPIPKKKP